jgi:hypothetical protein
MSPSDLFMTSVLISVMLAIASVILERRDDDCDTGRA